MTEQVKLTNLNPTDAEVELFKDHSMYLVSVSNGERSYKKINDIDYVHEVHETTGEFPNFLIPHRENILNTEIIIDLKHRNIRYLGIAADVKYKEKLEALANEIYDSYK